MLIFFRNDISEKQNELNGEDGFDEVQDEKLDDFSSLFQDFYGTGQSYNYYWCHNSAFYRNHTSAVIKCELIELTLIQKQVYAQSVTII